MIYPIIAIPSAGYGFSSWSATAGTFSTTNAQATIYSSSNTDATITINGTSYISTEMQDLSQSSCTSTPTRVRDVRDNHVYTIQRLADNNCWMMENLDLGRTALTTDLTSTNTNLSTTIAAATFNGWNTSSNVPSDTKPGLISVSGADFVSGTPHGSFYNYCAVSAGTICTSINNSNDATYDICPAGWRLPTGGDSGELKALYSLSNYDTLEELRAPITSGGGAFALAGDYTSDQSEINNQGNYWGSTRDDNYRMHYLSITKYGINTYGGQRNYGNSVRCIRKP